MKHQKTNNGCNCNSRTPKTKAEPQGDKPFDGAHQGCNEQTTDLLNHYCGTDCNGIDRDMMDRSFSRNCGCKEEYAADYSVDECVADDVENAAAQRKDPALSDIEAADDPMFENGESRYHSTCEYTMIPANCTDEDDIFNAQGS